MDLIKWEKIDLEIDIAREEKNWELLDKTDIALEALKKQEKGNLVVKNKCTKYQIKCRAAIGGIYEGLEKEEGGRPCKNSSSQLTSSQQAEEKIGKSRETINKYVKLIETGDEFLDEYSERCNENEKEMSTAGFLRFVERVTPEVKPDEIIEETERYFETEEYKIYNKDFADVDILDGMVDIIITDPPYGIDYRDEWEKLAIYAKKVLKKNGFLVSYFGEINLPIYLNILSEHLYYYWTFALIHSGKKQLVFSRNILCGWKPIVIFQNGYKEKKDQIEDIIYGTGREKTSHEWQQAEGELESLISNFTQQGDVVLDPFMGSATTLIKTIKMNRKGIGIERDRESFRDAAKRLREL